MVFSVGCLCNATDLHRINCRAASHSESRNVLQLHNKKTFKMLSASRRAISSGSQRLQMLTQSQRALASRSLSTSSQCGAKQKPVGEGGPIPFSSSKAASWSMTKSVVLPKRDVPWYQTWSVGASVLVFMIYFLCLREENDLDQELNSSLFERVPQLEEHQLKVALDYNRRQGIDTRDLEQRLGQLQRDKQQQKEQSS